MITTRRAPARADVVTAALALAVFLASAAYTLWSVRTMSTVMPMPGGWDMTMLWTAMPGETRLGAAVLFVVMWLAMMVTMMTPATLPLLLLYRRLVLVRAEPHAHAQVWLAGAAYLSVWLLFGLASYGAGTVIAAAAMRSSTVSQLVPVAAGGALLAAGVYQLTPWKRACLDHCRDPIAFVATHGGPGPMGALRLGARHGLYCTACCWGLMTIQLITGVMQVELMIALAIVISLERLAPKGERVALLTGVAAVLWGLALIARATVR